MSFFCRKFTTIKCQMKTSAWSLRQITQSIRIGLMRSEKCRKLSFSLNEKRLSNLRFKNSKMNRRRSSRTSRSSRKIAWRIRLWISRSDLQPWKSKRIVNDAFRMSKDTTMTAWTTKTTCVVRRRKKWCRWRNLKWSWSRSCRIRRLCRRTLTRSWSAHSRNLLLWWHPTMPKNPKSMGKCDPTQKLQEDWLE